MVVELLAAVGLLSGVTAWGSAILALGCLLVPVSLWLVRTGDDAAGLPVVLRSFALAVPAVLVMVQGRHSAGPDVVSWLSGLPVAHLVTVVVTMVLAVVSLGLRLHGRRPAAFDAPPANVPPFAAPPRHSTAVPPPSAIPSQPSTVDARLSTVDARSTIDPRSIVDVQPSTVDALSRVDAQPSTIDASSTVDGRSTVDRRRFAAALIRPGPELTIGMATYDDFDGVYFTIQALRLYHDLEDTELLVVDNYGCSQTADFVRGWARSRYILAKDVVGTAAPKDLVFRKASGQAVLCCDSHVLFVPGAIARLRRFYREHPDCGDLLQGPLVYDDGELVSTHFDPVWRDQMWGIWATDERGYDRDGEPFEIPMQGLGVFSCRAEAWPGFHPEFRGFGGEEGYLHLKFRRAGRRCLCLPWLRWMHRFGRPRGVPYPLTVEDKLRNYLLGHAELGLDPAPVLSHFAQYLPADRIDHIAAQITG